MIRLMLFTLIPLSLIAQDDFERFNAKPENVEVKDAVQADPSLNPSPGIKVKVGGKEKSVESSAPRAQAKKKTRTRRSRRNENFRARETEKMSGQEEKVFGRETIQAKAKKEKKYFNLNPETAFGPEIIKSFDFPNSDVLEITKFMQKQTGINLILEKDMKGKKISITAPTPITVGDAWKAYLVALNMAGLSLIKTGQFYRIISSRDIRYTPTKIYTGEFTPDVENYMMKIIALKYVDASEIVRNFRPFMSRYGRILDIKQTNTIIITDTGTNINRLMKLVTFLDVPGYDESMHIIPVKNTSAQELAKLLDSILKDDKSSSRSSRRKSSRSKTDSGTGANISKIIAEPRTNSIIAMANKSGAEQLRDLIAKLDVSNAVAGSGKIQVYYLQYGDAESLSQTLTTLISNTKSASSSRTSSRTSSRRSSRTASSGGSNTIFNEEVKITADKSTNSLVVTASPTDWLTVKSVIKKLDIPRDQVYVEGLIMETSVDVTKSFGVSYAGVTGTGVASRVGFNAGEVAPLATSPLGINDGVFAGIGLGGVRSVNIPNVGDVDISPINVLVKAASTDADTNILATPQLLVMDNTEGTFEVGSQIPILQTNTAGTGLQTQNVQFQDVTMKIKITPQINKVTRFVTMKIDQSIKDFRGTSATAQTSAGGVATDVRNAVTEVVVRDGDTVAMGGLLRNKVTETASKVPLLGDIPVLGWLFKSKTKNKEKTNVLFFLSPKIISPYQRVAAETTIDKLDRRSKELEKLSKKDFISDEVASLRDKLEKQKEGPLYDDEQALLYENKDEGIGRNDSVTIDDVKKGDSSGDESIPENIEFEL